MRVQVQNTILYVKGLENEGRITKQESRTFVRSLRDFDESHKGCSRYNFNLYFEFWVKDNIYDILIRRENESD